MAEVQGSNAPSSSQAIAVATLFPLGGILLTLSGLTLTGTVIALTVMFPLFILFSPVLVPAAILLGLALTGFLGSGAMGLTGVTAFTWVLRMLGTVFSAENLERLKRKMAKAAGQVGQQTKDVGQGVQSRARDFSRA